MPDARTEGLGNDLSYLFLFLPLRVPEFATSVRFSLNIVDPKVAK